MLPLSKLLFVLLFLQQPANMPGVENSVGYLASGTSIEPRTTSESESMIRASLGNWTLMFHAKYELPGQLKSSYGNNPAGVVMFLRLRPVGNLTEHMRQMHRQ